MSIKKININQLASFINFEFDISREGIPEKYITIFGTNGSGKSSLVNMLGLLNRYQVETNEDNLKSLKDFLAKRISKESIDNKIQIDISFDDCSQNILFDCDTNQLAINEKWKKLKVFNENYTNATIGSHIDINLKENGLIIGEPNIELDRERIKQKKLVEEEVKLKKQINDAVDDIQKNYKTITGSTAQSNLDKISKEDFLADVCIYINDPTLLTQKEVLGKKKQEQKSNIIDIKRLNGFFDLTQWEALFNEEIIKPELANEYQNLLIKYSDFYKQGMNIDDDLLNKCPYCLQEWDKKTQILSDFQKYLESQYNTKKEKVESLKNKLLDFEKVIKEKNKELELQEKVVIDECITYSIDSSKYKAVAFDKKQIQNIVDLIDEKIENMDQKYSIKEALNNLQSHYSSSFEISIEPLLAIKQAIDKRASLVMRLNKEIAEHLMKVFWEEKKQLRNDFKKIVGLIEKSNTKIKELEVKNEDINTIQEVFNGLLKFIGLEEYYLDSDNKLQLQIDSNYDISNEGARISSAQRKILSLCYFYAELISEVNNEKELKDYTIIYDDPLDSADYIFFHSITSLIENIETVLSKILKKDSINIGQHIVFTHNSLLFNRLTQNFKFCKKMNKVNQITKISKADKIESNYKIYLELIVDFYKKPTNEIKEKIFIGNIIRRVLEIVISFNELNSNNVSIIKDYGKPTLGMIANHLSHENFSKVLNPLPTDDEMKKACEELFEIIKDNHPKQYEYIETHFLA